MAGDQKYYFLNNNNNNNNNTKQHGGNWEPPKSLSQLLAHLSWA